MAFDFWDDVIKPAWHNVVQCIITPEMWDELCGALDLSLIDKIDNKHLAYLMRSLRKGNARYKGTREVLAMMMTFHRSHSGVEHFMRALRVSSPDNEVVVIMLEKIWQQMKDKHPSAELREHSKKLYCYYCLLEYKYVVVIVQVILLRVQKQHYEFGLFVVGDILTE